MFCSKTCSEQYKTQKNIIGFCEYCKQEKVLFDTISYNQQDLSFCSESELKISSFSFSSTQISATKKRQQNTDILIRLIKQLSIIAVGINMLKTERLASVIQQQAHHTYVNKLFGNAKDNNRSNNDNIRMTRVRCITRQIWYSWS